ncbi:MAG: MFS transporter [Deltaproteobacteria bacterium]|nr:MFS transporter [Deltaproteobacteria bacterium]
MASLDMNGDGRPIGPDPGDLGEAFLARRRKLILWTAITSNILGNSGLIGLNVALPVIQREMGLGAVQVSWLALSTLLAMAMASAPVARLSDLVGRHRITVIGLWVTIVTSLLGALSTSYATLVISRAFCGLGLVSFFTTITTMVTAEYPPRERGRVLGLTISSVYVGLSVGPLLVGFLVQYLGWRSLFWYTVFGMIPPLVLIKMVSPDSPPTPDERLDWVGAILWILGLGLGFTGLASLGRGFAVPALAGGLVLVALFFLRSLGSGNPILDMRLFFDSRRFSFSSLAAYISYLSSFSITFLMSLYLQYTKGLSPSHAGIYLMAQPVVQAALTPLSGKLSDRMEPSRLASGGLFAILAAILVFALMLGEATPDAILIATMALTGAGFAFFSAPNSNSMMSSVPPMRLGQASGVITVTRLCGQISSMALTTLVFGLVIGEGAITPEKYPAFLSASRACFWIFAPICLTGILASLACRTGPKRD